MTLESSSPSLTGIISVIGLRSSTLDSEHVIKYVQKSALIIYIELISTNIMSSGKRICFAHEGRVYDASASTDREARSANWALDD